MRPFAVVSFIFVAVLVTPTFAANILFFFAGGNVSMKNSAWPWVLELAKRGHNVTFLSPHEKTPMHHPNITDLAAAPLLKMVAHVYLKDRFKDRDDGNEKDFDYNLICTETCKAVIQNRDSDPALSSIFRGSYDLVVVNVIFNECGYFIAKHFQTKTIGYIPCTIVPWLYDVYGISPEAAWIPDLYYTSKKIPLGLLERAYSTYIELYWAWDHSRLSPQLENIVEPLLGKGNTSSLHELANNVNAMLLSAHHAMDFARTLPPLFVDIGGMGISGNSKKELPQNFKDFMDNSGTGGAVLITFGSTVLLNTVSERYQKMFFDMISALPHVNFLMRWSGPIPKFLKEQPRNLLVSEWLPQKEILSHPRLKAFITHGGISSIQEATYNGVPICVIPLFADQDYNAYRIATQEVGERIEVREMTADSFAKVVKKVLEDEKYKRNMMRKSAIFRDRPLSPVDTAVFWTEFALRHDETISTLRPQNHHLNVFQRRLLDVFMIFQLVVFVIFLALFVVLKLALKLFFSMISSRHMTNSQKAERKIRKTE